MKVVIKHGYVCMYEHTCERCTCVFQYTSYEHSNKDMEYYTNCPYCEKSVNCTRDVMVKSSVEELINNSDERK